MKLKILFPILLVIAALALVVYVATNQPPVIEYPTEIRVEDEQGDLVMVVSSGPATRAGEAEAEAGEESMGEEGGEAGPQGQRDLPPDASQPQNQMPQEAQAPQEETAYGGQGAGGEQTETQYQ